MKLSKLIRQQRKAIAERDDQLETARALWQQDRPRLRELRALHRPTTVPNRLGRPGQTEVRCNECINRLFPCRTRRLVDEILTAAKAVRS